MDVVAEWAQERTGARGEKELVVVVCRVVFRILFHGGNLAPEVRSQKN